MDLGIDRLLEEPDLQAALQGKRCALVGHPASMTSTMIHSLDALSQVSRISLTAAFGPQHGMRGDKQDNMIESPDFLDPIHGIPVYSLYGKVRRPTHEMMDQVDVLLFDVQDIGCRIYTYATTLLYLLEACAQHRKSIWILDRPNPAGRPMEGTRLQEDWESFVGAAPMLMRHGLTMAELAQWYVGHFQLDVDMHIVAMRNYDPTQPPGYGWPLGQLSWVNPSPNASSVNMARCFSGTVLLEGTTLSEGRGTTTALELLGAPDIDVQAMLQEMRTFAPQWMQGVFIRPCFFEPTFHKHHGKLCQGIQLHTDNPAYAHKEFRPFRLACLFLKALRQLHANYEIWRYHAYEYEQDRTPIDLITGGTLIREWVDDPAATAEDLETVLLKDEADWREECKPYMLYPG